MNDAICEERVNVLNNWKKQRMGKTVSIDTKKGGTLSVVITPELTVDSPTMKELLDVKVGIPSSGPMSILAANRMISKKGLQLRLIHKPCPPKVVPADDNIDGHTSWPQFPSVRDRSLKTPYAGREDLAWLRDSGMSLLFLVFYITEKEHERLSLIENALKTGAFNRDDPAVIDDGKGVKDGPGHVNCSPGNGRLYTDSWSKSKTLDGKCNAHIRTVQSGDFSFDTLCHMYPTSTPASFATAGMLVYEIVPNVLLEKRLEKHKTKCAEALLNEECVPGCNEAFKKKVFQDYVKPYPGAHNACVHKTSC